MVVCVGVIVFAAATQVRAEGGEGSSVIIPSETQTEAQNQAAGIEPVAADEQQQASADVKELQTNRKKELAAKSAKSAPQDVEQTSNTNALHKAETAELGDPDETEVVELPKGAGARLDVQRAAALRPLIQRYASEHQLPFALADAVVRLESRYNPAARNGANIGLTQISAATAKSLGYDGSASGLHDAETNLRYGLKYLAMAYRLANQDTCGTILRYQFGHRASTMTGASQKYCAKVKTILAASR